MRDPGALDVGIVDVVSGESTVWESSLIFTVRLSNASPEPMILEGASHKIYFNGSYVGLGLSNERVEVPRLGTATQAVTVRVRNLTVLKKVLEMAEGQSSSVVYRVNSTLYGGGTLGRRVSAPHGPRRVADRLRWHQIGGASTRG